MNMERFLVLATFTLCIGCQPAPDAPRSAPANESPPTDNSDDQPAENPASQESGTGGGPGTGAGGGRGTGGGRDIACADEITLILDGEMVWRRTRDELAADPAVGPLEGYRDEARPVVRLGDFLAEFHGLRGIRVSSCGARGVELNAGQLLGAPLYLERGASGRWRLVDLANPEMPTIFIRDVARIELSTTEGPGGGDSPG